MSSVPTCILTTSSSAGTTQAGSCSLAGTFSTFVGNVSPSVSCWWCFICLCQWGVVLGWSHPRSHITLSHQARILSHWRGLFYCLIHGGIAGILGGGAWCTCDQSHTSSVSHMANFSEVKPLRVCQGRLGWLGPGPHVFYVWFCMEGGCGGSGITGTTEGQG